MNANLFKCLPSDIIIDVLSRLPVRSVVCCKFVCKSWLYLVETDNFIKAHHSKSVPALLLRDRQYKQPFNMYKLFDLEDGDVDLIKVFYLEDGLNEKKPLTNFNLPHFRLIYGSSGGLLFSRDRASKPHEVYIYNPITRECIELRGPQEFVCSASQVTYGFGRSKITGQHKVVAISEGVETNGCLSKSECRVYTLGTGSWRTINAPGPTFKYGWHPAFFNGNLHWLVYDPNHIPSICCFNLETELFSTFSTPTIERIEGIGGYSSDVYVLGDCLGLCGYTSDRMFLWIMKDYGVEKSWTKYAHVPTACISYFALLHTPSFLSLKSFAMEKVCSL